MRPLLVASLGNPGSVYAHTLHSAGHTLLQALQRATGLSPLVKDRKFGNGAISHGPGFSLWQSSSYMNDSGSGLAAAWRAFCTQLPMSDDPDVAPFLVVLHDDLELDLGRCTIKSGVGKSARGHNGLKSFLGMPGMKALDFARVGVGIGPRPLSRDSDEVAKFVLKKMTPAQKMRIEDCAAPVWEACGKMMEGKKNFAGNIKAMG